MIQLRDITKSYGTVTPLENVSLDIDRGEFVAIVGPSGSGKTTFLNTVAGLLTPTGGEVFVDGTSVYAMGSRDRAAFRRERFGFVFQAFNLIPYFTAVENVQVPSYLRGMSNGCDDAYELLEWVGLKEKAQMFPSQLSIGEQQRVAIARALASQPAVIFADEPTGNLDARTAKQVMSYLMDFNRSGVTLLLVTHDPAMADMAERTMILVDGRMKS